MKIKQKSQTHQIGGAKAINDIRWGTGKQCSAEKKLPFCWMYCFERQQSQSFVGMAQSINYKWSKEIF